MNINFNNFKGMKPNPLVLWIVLALVRETSQVESKFTLANNFTDVNAANDKKETFAHCVVHMIPGNIEVTNLIPEMKKKKPEELVDAIMHLISHRDEEEETDRLRMRRLLEEEVPVQNIKKLKSNKQVKNRRLGGEQSKQETETKSQENLKSNTEDDEEKNKDNENEKLSESDSNAESNKIEVDSTSKTKLSRAHKRKKNQTAKKRTSSSESIYILAPVPDKLPTEEAIRSARNYVLNSIQQSIGLTLVADCSMFYNGQEVKRVINGGFCNRNFDNFKMTHYLKNTSSESELRTKTFQIDYSGVTEDEVSRTGFYIGNTNYYTGFNMKMMTSKCHIYLDAGVANYAWKIIIAVVALLVLAK